ncbi:serine hydrolase [Mesobacillus thioparans]|uniref:serine hydrolase n=1 Tax=Mesobacillus thioparans TaxID=370439 RepID=UPI0039EE1EB1
MKKYVSALMIILLFISTLMPINQAEAAMLNSYQVFDKAMKKELNQYIKKSGGTVTLHYRDLTNGDEYKINSTSAKKAASTIKLPLALYVMELAAANKINLNQKLTYKSYHYYGGSGVIQYDRVGTKYTIRDLVKKAMVHSDNIAFIMLKEKVGRSNFNSFLKKVGGKYAYPGGQNVTSSKDLVVYANRLYDFAEKNELGKELVGYLMKTDYNTTIPKGIKGAKTAHKVGMIPMSLIYNDVAIVYDKNPFALAIMTNNISYAKSQKVIADLAAIVHKHHKKKNKATFFKTKKKTIIYKNTTGKLKKLGSLGKGQSFKILSTTSKWYQIEFGGEKAYVEKTSVTVYPQAPSGGFTLSEVKEKGIVTVNNTTPFRSKAAPNGKPIATVYKGSSLSFYKTSGDYYKVLLGKRSGYIHKNAVKLEFSSSIKYFQVNQDHVALFILKDKEYVQVGSLEKGQVFPRVREYGVYSEVSLGTEKGYVLKAETSPLLTAKVHNSISANVTKGNVKLTQDALALSSAVINSPALGKLNKDTTVSFLEKNGEWYVINFLGRKAYLHSSSIEQ